MSRAVLLLLVLFWATAKEKSDSARKSGEIMLEALVMEEGEQVRMGEKAACVCRLKVSCHAAPSFNVLSGPARAGPLFASSAHMPRKATNAVGVLVKKNSREISEAEGDPGSRGRPGRLANADSGMDCMHTHILK